MPTLFTKGKYDQWISRCPPHVSHQNVHHKRLSLMHENMAQHSVLGHVYVILLACSNHTS